MRVSIGVTDVFSDIQRNFFKKILLNFFPLGFIHVWKMFTYNNIKGLGRRTNVALKIVLDLFFNLGLNVSTSAAEPFIGVVLSNSTMSLISPDCILCLCAFR